MKSISGWISILLICSLLSSLGCGKNSSASNAPKSVTVEGRAIRVVSTVGMLNDIVKIIGGDKVDAVGMMGPGIDPHTYNATARDVQLLENADVIFYVGLELEGRMTEILEKLSELNKQVTAVGESVPKDKLRQPAEFEGRYDPHLWFDPMLWTYAIQAVQETLAQVNPSAAPEFQSRAEELLKKINELDEYAKSELGRISTTSRYLITAHDAFGYFGARYDITVLGIQGTSTASEASANTIARLADLIAKNRIPAIFVESSVPRSTIEALQKAVISKGWKVKIGGELFSDAMGADGTPEGTYLGMFRHNIDTIVKALVP